MKNSIILLAFILAVFSLHAQTVSEQVKIDTLHTVWVFNSLTIRNTSKGLVSAVRWDDRDSLSNKLIRSRTFTYSDSMYNDWWNNFNSGHYLTTILYSSEGMTPLDSNKIDSLFINKPPFRH